MSQNTVVLPTTGTVSGLQMTQATNNALDTIATMWSGASAPSAPIAGQIWHDTTNNILKKRNLANTAWISLFNINETLAVADPVYPDQRTGFCNRIINGAMNIDQVNEGGSYTLPTNNTWTYVSDQWRAACLSSTANAVTVQNISTSPPTGLQKSLAITVGTGASSVGGTDYLVTWQQIEANDVSDFGFGGASAQPFSISFWVKASVTGTFNVAIQNEAGNRSIIRPFTISSANTWTYVTLNNIPGDTSGTWVMNGTAAAMRVYFTAAVGATYQTATTNAWLSGSYYGSTAQTNTPLTTSGATFQITGVMMNRGPFCLPFEKLSAQQDLVQCQRFYWKTFPTGIAVAQNAGITGAIYILSVSTVSAANWYHAYFPATMRVAPSLTTYNPSANNANWRNSTAGADVTAAALSGTQNQVGIYAAGTTAVTDNLRIHATANARF